MVKILSVKDSSLTAVADSIRKKTGKSEKLTFPAEFVSEIESITTGGGGSTPAVEVQLSDVNFFDYDGTIIASYTEEQAKALTELPTPPEHDGLVFQGWNYTLEEVIANADAADVGALYITDDGATRLDIRIASNERKNILISIYQTKSAGVLIDWGDGSSERTIASTVCTVAHEYESAGLHKIKFFVDEDCEIYLPYLKNTLSQTQAAICATQLEAVYSGDRVTGIAGSAYKKTYGLKKIAMSKDIKSIGTEVFYNSGITYITIPPAVTKITGDMFDNCTCLKNISLPINVATIDANAFRDCWGLERIIIKHVTNPGDYAFFENYNLKKISFNSEVSYISNYICRMCTSLVEAEFLGNVKTFYDGALQYCYSLKKLDLSHCTAVPSLQTTNVFTELPSDLQILVPAALADEWKKATNWTVYADNIIGV